MLTFDADDPAWRELGEVDKRSFYLSRTQGEVEWTDRNGCALLVRPYAPGLSVCVLLQLMPARSLLAQISDADLVCPIYIYLEHYDAPEDGRVNICSCPSTLEAADEWGTVLAASHEERARKMIQLVPAGSGLGENVWEGDMN